MIYYNFNTPVLQIPLVNMVNRAWWIVNGCSVGLVVEWAAVPAL